MKVLTESRYSFTTTAEREIGRDVKEKLCYVALDYDTALKSTAESSDKEHTYVPSDENCVVVVVVAERFRCAQMLLLPSVIGKETYRIHDTSFQNVMKHDVDIRVNLYANVVLSSSTTMFQEIGECMTKATDGVGSIHDVLARAFLSSFFSGHLRTTLPTLHRAQMTHVQEKTRLRCVSRPSLSWP